MIKSKLITSFFQNLLNDKDIKIFKNKFYYYLFFRVIRNFLSTDLIIKIYNFKIFGSIDKNKTSHFLLKKCEFGDYHELDTIKKFSKLDRVLLLDCGCNYGFYSFYTASLARKNLVISIEASKQTSSEFIKNLNLNNLSNINFFNKAISDNDDIDIIFNEGVNDWESSQTHKNFKVNKIEKITTITIDTILKFHNLDNYKTIIKLDIEGNEMKAIQGALQTIENFSPMFIIEFSKFIFEDINNQNYLKNFLLKYNYSIYNTNNIKINFDNIMIQLNQLHKNHKTIGNFYLIKNNSISLNIFLSNE